MTMIGTDRIVLVIERGRYSAATRQVAGKVSLAGAVNTVGKASGVTGAVLNAGIETLYSTGEVIRGKKDVMDAAGNIAYAGAKGGASAYAGGVAGSVAAAATTAAIGFTGIGAGLAAGGVAATAVALAPAAVGLGAACVVGSLVCDVIDDIFS
jgi:hypothetical protein